MSPSISRRIWYRTETLIVGALVLAATLTWKDAIQFTIKRWLPNSRTQLVGVFAAAVLITVMAAIASVLVSIDDADA